MKTGAIISFGVLDTTAKDNVTTSATNAQPFSDYKSITNNDTTTALYGTLEPLQCILDGSLHDFPEQPSTAKLGIWGIEQSNDSGILLKPMMITCLFATLHTISGLTLDTNAKDITIKWYTLGDSVVKNYVVNSNSFICEETVVDFNKIEITIVSLREVNRYLKFNDIKFGITYTFADKAVISCKVVEELSPTSEEITSNYCDFSFYDERARFNMLDETGANKALQESQQIVVQCIVNDNISDLGTFYLASWKNNSPNVLSCKTYDAISLLDTKEFKGGMLDTTVEELLPLIISTPYILHNSLKKVIVKGYLPILSCRQALLQLAFSIGATVDCSRGNSIKIYPMAVTPSKLLTSKDQFLAPSATQLKRRTHISATVNKLVADGKIDELFKGFVDGKLEIRFKSPYHNLSITGGSILERHINYVVITANNTQVILTGSKYNITEDSYARRIVPENLKIDENTIKITDSWLLNTDNLANVLNAVESYYSNLIAYTYKTIWSNTLVGDIILIDAFNKRIKGYITKQEIDVAKGLSTNVHMVGNSIILLVGVQYCGELSCGEVYVI